ncbi:putative RiPP precursor [Mesorhizobium sp. B3-1-9]|nr:MULTISPECIES: putative RiPP precursor [unclassified Mesorhizobium]TPI36815.1 putative RiPP precursor [Mesorhizobium sp. B3-1-9]TPI63465.1 putative RiPP precursor [Mesorhizobium sp. B3-1-8]TPI72186.1 putative RiPP precursor [Mesorhizobium sp. B3-1-3]
MKKAYEKPMLVRQGKLSAAVATASVVVVLPPG